MKKEITTLCTLLLIALSPSIAQTTYFATSFDEGIPESFSLYDLDQKEPSTDMKKLGFAVGIPWIGLVVDKDNNHVAASTSWYRTGAKSNDWMVTHGIAIESEKAVVSWRSKASDKDYADGFKVYISTTGSTPDDFDTSSPAFSVNKESATWTEHVIDLSSHVGKTVYIAFVNDTKDKAMLYVDDLFIGVPSAVGLTLDFGRCYDGYGDITISGKVFATGEESVTGYTIGFSMNGQTYTETFDNTLDPGKQTAFTLSEKPYLERNTTAEYTAWIKSGDDSTGVKGRISAYLWKIVTEEVTGTWCQYCVRGIGAMNYMRENYPDGHIGIAIHNNSSIQVPDSMAIEGEEYRKWIMSSYSMSGYPHCVVNRNSIYSIDPAYIPDAYLQIKQQSENFTGMSLSATYNTETGLIEANTNVYFANDYTDANFKLAYIVIENDVHRTHAETGILDNYCGYDQINAYAGGASGKCYGFEDLPSIINADNIWYQDVARGYGADDAYKGIAGLFSSTINDGDVFTHEYSLSMPETVLKPENTELVVILLDKNGTVRNAEKCAPTFVTNGISVATVSSETSTDNGWYNIMGERVEHPVKGIYIHNGKKIIVR